MTVTLMHDAVPDLVSTPNHIPLHTNISQSKSVSSVMSGVMIG